jgi:hypothetical protein
MGLRLTLGSIEGMKELPRAEQNEIFWNHFLKAFRHGKTWIGLLLLCAGSALGQGIGWLLGGETPRMILGLVGFVIGLFVASHLALSAITLYIEEALAYRKQLARAVRGEE